MKNLSRIILVAAFCFAPNAFAGLNKRVLKTQKRHIKRINRGVKSGELTKREARKLRQDQKKINRMRKEAKMTDGRIDKIEMKFIRQAQARLSAKIYKKRRNKKKRSF